jgi:hypothetical protein
MLITSPPDEPMSIGEVAFIHSLKVYHLIVEYRLLSVVCLLNNSSHWGIVSVSVVTPFLRL